MYSIMTKNESNGVGKELTVTREMGMELSITLEAEVVAVSNR